eukprot:TRINITY_DN6762_c0_g1_i5.p1 TRINITY_DN6762_c0_g1~~TRINITY_DN6762_c0_g1_i5.p1  ORF type:complete len:204 (+),score=63.21 TRINITY_DN6762_c0_g1_i5:33-614(+)
MGLQLDFFNGALPFGVQVKGKEVCEFERDGLRLSQGTYLLIKNTLGRNDKGDCLNVYTLVMNVRIPKRKLNQAMISCSPLLDAIAIINNKAGFGVDGQYGRVGFQFDALNSLAITRDKKGCVRHFVNGRVACEVPRSQKDGRFSLMDWFGVFGHADEAYCGGGVIHSLSLFASVLDDEKLLQMAQAVCETRMA